MERNNPVDLLKRNRPMILLTEIIGFLHDLGKLDNECYDNHNQRIWTEFKIEEKYDYSSSENQVPKIIFNLFRNIELERAFDGKIDKKILQFLSQRTNSNSVHNFPTVGSPIFYHHYYGEFKPRNIFEKIIADSDSQDSEEDRGVSEKDHSREFYIATPFGHEEKLDDKIRENLEELKVKDRTECRRFFYAELEKIIKEVLLQNEMIFKSGETSWENFRNEFNRIVQIYFPLSLAETRRPANDINLYDHSYMTGSIAKTVITNIILSEDFRKEIQGQRRYSFKLLVVGFRGYEFLTNVNRIPDFIGRKMKLEKMRDNIRKFVEFDVPIGNLVYEDMNVMCFLVPDFREAEHERKVMEELKKLIVDEFLKETNGILFPYVEIVGDSKNESSQFIGILIENAKEIFDKKINFPYHKAYEFPWINEWERKWICFNCNDTFETTKDGKCPRCNSKKIKKREKCFVCNYAPEYPIREGVVSVRGERLCHYCYTTRLEGIAERQNEIRTLWLDELRDDDNRIVLILGKITPVKKWLSGDLIRKTTKNFNINPKNAGNLEEILKLIRASYEGPANENLKMKVREKLESSPRAIELFEINLNKFEKKNPSSEEINKSVNEIKSLLCEKSDSPSRLRRTWQELLHFPDESERNLEGYFKKNKISRKRLIIKIDTDLSSDKQEHMLGDAKISNTDIGCIVYGKDRTITTANYLNSKFNGISINEYEEEELKKLLEKASIDIEWYDGSSNSAKIETIEKVEYFVPIISVYKSAGEFMFLCPASYGILFSNVMRNNFFEIYKKALGKLNLNIGLIYFKYKQPLYLILDAGKRLLSEFENEELQEEVKCNLKKKKWELQSRKTELEDRSIFL